jgi:hypothetical protein
VENYSSRVTGLGSAASDCTLVHVLAAMGEMNINGVLSLKGKGQLLAGFQDVTFITAPSYNPCLSFKQ